MVSDGGNWWKLAEIAEWRISDKTLSSDNHANRPNLKHNPHISNFRFSISGANKPHLPTYPSQYTSPG